MKSIDIQKANLLNEKIFKAEEIQKKEKCRLCHEETDCFNSKKYISFPKILIIVIKNDQIGKLNIEKEIKNDEGISYELYSIIEAYTNRVYFKNNQNGLWFNYNDNKRDEIESKIPIVLFYKLFTNNNQINNNNQNLIINNTNNMNNIININYINNINTNNINDMNNINNIYNINNTNNMNNINNMNNMNNINNMNIINNLNNMNKMSNMNNINNMNNNKAYNDNLPVFIKFKNGINIGYINAKESQTFNDVIKILERKYKWIKPLEGKKFYSSDSKEIGLEEKKLAIKSLNIIDNSLITIK